MDINSVLNNSAVSKCKGVGPRNSAVPSLSACRRSDVLYESPFDILVTDYVYPALDELLRLLRRVPAAVLFLDVRGIFVEGPISTFQCRSYTHSHTTCYVSGRPRTYYPVFSNISYTSPAELTEQSRRERNYSVAIGTFATSSFCGVLDIRYYTKQRLLFIGHRDNYALLIVLIQCYHILQTEVHHIRRTFTRSRRVCGNTGAYTESATKFLYTIPK